MKDFINIILNIIKYYVFSQKFWLHKIREIIMWNCKNTGKICIALCFGLTLMASSVDAAGRASKEVRIAQARLSNLGYYNGNIDGVMGKYTVEAIEEFQSHNGLAVTGTLNSITYSSVREAYYAGWHGHYTYSNDGRMNYNYHLARYDDAQPWKTQEGIIQHNASAHLTISEEKHGAVSNYAVMLNGMTVLNALGQPRPPYISERKNINGEDEVFMSAISSASSCGHKDYLLTIFKDGTFNGAHELRNCTEYQDKITERQVPIENLTNVEDHTPPHYRPIGYQESANW